MDYFDQFREDSAEAAAPAAAPVALPAQEAPRAVQVAKQQTIAQMDQLSREVEQTNGDVSTVHNRADKEKIRKALGWMPPDLLDKRQFPDLQQILKHNDVVRPLVFALNEGMLTISSAIVGLVKTRDAISQVLKMNGGSNAESSEHIGKIVLGSQRAMAKIGEQSSGFVEAMAVTARETGKVAYALRWGASPEDLAESLRKATESVRQSEESMKVVLTEECAMIDESLTQLSKMVMRENVLTNIEKEMGEFDLQIAAQSKEVEVLHKNWFDKMAQVRARMAIAREEERQRVAREKMIKQQYAEMQAMWQNVEARRQELDGRLKTLDTQERDDEESCKRASAALVEEMQDLDRQFQQMHQQQEKERLRARAKRNANIEELKQLEKSADTGGRTVKRRGWWFWGSTTTETRPNKQAEYRALIAERRRQNAADDEREQRMQQQMLKFQQEQKAATRAEVARQQGRALDDVQRRFSRKKEEVAGQQAKLLQLQESIRLKKEGLKLEIDNNGVALKEARAAIETASTRKLELEGEPKAKLDKAIEFRAQTEKRRAAKREELDLKLKEISQKFGQDKYTFVTFMRLLSHMRDRAQNLGVSFGLMATAVTAAQKSFGTDFFFNQLQTIPERARGRAMQELAQHFQTACMVGQSALQQPLRALVLRDAERHDALHAGAEPRAALPAQEGVRIEEVPPDADAGPARQIAA